MKIASKHRKWIRRIIILLLIRLAISGVLYYVIVYRFKELVQIAVHNQSRGLYSFEASHIDFSLFKRHLIINDARVFCTDTSHTAQHYDVSVPKINLAIKSWRALIFHQRVLVDSLLVEGPVVNEHEHLLPSHKYSKAGIEPNEVISMLKSMTRHLQITKLKVVGGMYTYSNLQTVRPFIVSHINFYLRNFTKRNNTSHHFFSSEEIEINIDRQRWELPDGKHYLSFKRLHFSGRSQFVKIDSCVYHEYGDIHRGDINFKADRLLFNSRSLAVNYIGSKIIIDTLICQYVSVGIYSPKSDKFNQKAASSNNAEIFQSGRAENLGQLLHIGKPGNSGQLPQSGRPVVHALPPQPSKPANQNQLKSANQNHPGRLAVTEPLIDFTDKKQVFDQSLIRLFKNIQFRYIDIKGGQLRFISADRPLEFSKHLNLKVYNLFVPSDSSMSLCYDSISPKILQLKFYR